MRLIFWIVALPLLLVAAFFAIAHRTPVELDLWPVAGRITVPLFIALVGALYLGFLFGVLVAWWSGRTARSRARAEARSAERLKEENQYLKARLEALEPKPAPAIEQPPSPSDARLPAPVAAGPAWPAA